MFYELFGMKFTKQAHGNGPVHFSHEDRRGVFELYPANEPDRTGLGFAVPDLIGLRESLETGGFSPEPIRDQSWGRTFIVHDPDQRRVEVKEVS